MSRIARANASGTPARELRFQLTSYDYVWLSCSWRQLGREKRLEGGRFEGLEAIFRQDRVDSLESDEPWRGQLDADEFSFLVDVQDHPWLDTTALRAFLVGFAREVEVRREGTAIFSVRDPQLDLLHLSSRRSRHNH